jgi:hypothetical protein
MRFDIALDTKTEDGSRMDFSATKTLGDFSKREAAGKTADPEMVGISTGEPYIRYNRDGAQLLYGANTPDEDTVVLSRMAYDQDLSGANALMKISVREAWWMDRFKGLRADKVYKQFLALCLDVEFPEAAQTPMEEYQIPSVFSNFYASINGVSFAASNATWLAETPLVEPGNPGFALKKGEKKSGVLVFLVDRYSTDAVTQLALHYYDTSYGHIQIPITGKTPENLLALDDLPQTAPGRISDAFELTVDKKSDSTQLLAVNLAQAQENNGDFAKNTSFRVLEGTFSSNVQALLNIDPKERFLYAIDTDQGPLVGKMSDIVYDLPMGFTGSMMLAPGSKTPVRMPFLISSALAGASSHIFADLQGGSVDIPVTGGGAYKTGGMGKTWHNEYFDLTVNALRRLRKGYGQVVLDFTINEKKDGMGLTGVGQMFALSKQETVGADGSHTLSESASKELGAQAAAGRKGLGSLNSNEFDVPGVATANEKETQNLLYGVDSDWAVLDGASRRGILMFDLPRDDDFGQWALTSAFIEDLYLPVEDALYDYTPLLAEKQTIERETDFLREIDEKARAGGGPLPVRPDRGQPLCNDRPCPR